MTSSSGRVNSDVADLPASLVELSGHLADHAWCTAGECKAVSTDATSDSHDEPEFRPHDNGSTRHHDGHTAVLTHTL